MILVEMMHHVRMIPLDNRPRPPQDVLNLTGVSRGRWEGETLVVEVTDFNEDTWFDRAGNFHSEALRVTERFRRMNAATLNIDITINDPKAYTKPWTATVRFERVSESDFGEHVCAVKSVS
jgi:hypothetical protein